MRGVSPKKEALVESALPTASSFNIIEALCLQMSYGIHAHEILKCQGFHGSLISPSKNPIVSEQIHNTYRNISVGTVPGNCSRN